MKKTALRNVSDRGLTLEDLNDYDPDDPESYEDWKRASREITEFDLKYQDTVDSSLKNGEKDDTGAIVKTLKVLEEAYKEGKLSKREYEARRHAITDEVYRLNQRRKRQTTDVDEMRTVIDRITEELKDLDNLQSDYNSADPITQVELANEIEEQVDSIFKLRSQLGRLERRIQYKLQKDKEANKEIVAEIIPAMASEGAGLSPEDYEDTEEDPDAEEDPEDEDTDAKAVIAKGVEYHKQALKAYKKVTAYIPNDVSVEKDITRVVKLYETVDKKAKEIAKTYGRDPKAQASVIAASALMGLPARALLVAMKANDKQEKVALSTQEVLNDTKTKGTIPKDVKRAQTDANTFSSALKAIEKNYGALLEYLPTSSRGGKNLKSLLNAHKAATTSLRKLSQSLVEEYPAAAVVLSVIADTAYRQELMLRKALT